jgi:hypothetical protein
MSVARFNRFKQNLERNCHPSLIKIPYATRLLRRAPEGICARLKQAKKEYGMKNMVNRMVVLFIVAIITSAAALANTTKKVVTFVEAVTVNGTLVKQGTYEVRFDDATNQLTILKGRKVIAQAEAQLGKVEGTKHFLYTTRPEINDATKPPALSSISLKGGNQATIISSGD